MVKAVHQKQEFESIINEPGNKVVVVDFFAEWCGPCKHIAPEMEKMESEFPGVLFLKVDVDELETLSEKYGVTAMPTIIIFKGSNVAKTVVGANLNAIRSGIKEVASS
eukprot:GHVQ01005120.1.p1 GENE.GHVQ01005120.1~~GHVQ01005120.1.p1  ORF type:complete len:108 (+),score=6.43 GHVQ01005120.1:254-577(+)